MKNAIVTGGTRGIGASISKALKDNGYNVIANYAGNDVKAKEQDDFGLIFLLVFKIFFRKDFLFSASYFTFN